jgi:hypothetical protein
MLGAKLDQPLVLRPAATRARTARRAARIDPMRTLPTAAAKANAGGMAGTRVERGAGGVSGAA